MKNSRRNQLVRSQPPRKRRQSPGRHPSQSNLSRRGIPNLKRRTRLTASRLLSTRCRTDSDGLLPVDYGLFPEDRQSPLRKLAHNPALGVQLSSFVPFSFPFSEKALNQCQRMRRRTSGPQEPRKPARVFLMVARLRPRRKGHEKRSRVMPNSRRSQLVPSQPTRNRRQNPGRHPGQSNLARRGIRN